MSVSLPQRASRAQGLPHGIVPADGPPPPPASAGARARSPRPLRAAPKRDPGIPPSLSLPASHGPAATPPVSRRRGGAGGRRTRRPARPRRLSRVRAPAGRGPAATRAPAPATPGRRRDPPVAAGNDHRAALDQQVAAEEDAVLLVEEADVVRRVTRRVQHAQRPVPASTTSPSSAAATRSGTLHRAPAGRLEERRLGPAGRQSRCPGAWSTWPWVTSTRESAAPASAASNAAR